MTEREQRIWDHVYAAEFVRLASPPYWSQREEAALHAAMKADDAIKGLRLLTEKKP